MNKNKLHNIKDSGFKAPENYFDGLEDSIMDQIKLHEKIEDTGFKSPDNYFDLLEDKIIDRVKHEPKVISLFNKRNLLYATSIAAALVIMFSIFINKSELTFADLETASIENYLNEEEIDSYEMASLLTEEELSADIFIDSDLTSESLEEYLLQNATIEDLIIE
jgi:hypothetical protein